MARSVAADQRRKEIPLMKLRAVSTELPPQQPGKRRFRMVVTLGFSIPIPGDHASWWVARAIHKFRMDR